MPLSSCKLSEKKLAMIIEGGCIRGSLAYGVLKRLDKISDEFSVDQIGLMAGSSAGAANMVYALSGDLYKGDHIWRNRISEGKFLNVGPRSFARADQNPEHKLLDIDYMVDEVFKKDTPIDLKKIAESGKEFYIPLLDVDTLELVYASNTKKTEHNGIKIIPIDLKNPDMIYDVLRAATAVPIVYDKAVEINGGRFIDGGLIELMPLDIPIPEDAKEILIFTRTAEGEKGFSKTEKGILKLYNNRQKRKGRAGLTDGVYELFFQDDSPNFEERLEKALARQKDGKAIVIMPSNEISTVDNDPKTIAANIQEGINTVNGLEGQIKDFLEVN